MYPTDSEKTAKPNSKFFLFVKKEAFFFITLALTMLASIVSAPQVAAIRWNVICALFCLLLVCAGFKHSNLLTSLASKTIRAFNTPRRLGFIIILITGGLAMLVTNDVALITVVPLTMIIAKLSGENPSLLIIMETLSANILSALTPFGNPQNLYLYSFYSIPTAEFFRYTAPVCILGLLLVLAVNFFFNGGGNYATDVADVEIRNKPLLAVSLAGFSLNVLSILRMVDYRISLAVTAALFLVFNWRMFLKVDYFLLLTFVCFFLFTSSVTGMPAVRSLFSKLLTTPDSVLIVSAAVSQVISNVPTAALLSGFTDHYRELLLGVTIGGAGTLIASLANLISFRIYAAEYKTKKYLRAYTLLNIGILIFLVLFAVI